MLLYGVGGRWLVGVVTQHFLVLQEKSDGVGRYAVRSGLSVTWL